MAAGLAGVCETTHVAPWPLTPGHSFRPPPDLGFSPLERARLASSLSRGRSAVLVDSFALDHWLAAEPDGWRVSRTCSGLHPHWLAVSPFIRANDDSCYYGQQSTGTHALVPCLVFQKSCGAFALEPLMLHTAKRKMQHLDNIETERPSWSGLRSAVLIFGLSLYTPHI